MLSLNLSKTNFMVFKPWQKKQSFECQVVINERPILRVLETMPLGVLLDDNVTWKSHIPLVATKMSKFIGIIHKSRFFSLCSLSSYLVLFNDPSILPLLQSSLGCTCKSKLKRIVILQKRTLRIVRESRYDARTDPIFKEQNLLNLSIRPFYVFI